MLFMSVSPMATLRSKSGTFRIWASDEGDFGGAAAHKFSARATGHRAFFIGLVTEIIYLQIKVVPKNIILGIARRIEESEFALNTDLIDIDNQCRGIAVFFRGAVDLCAGCFGHRFGGFVNVVGICSLHPQLGDVDALGLSAILEITVGG